MKARPAIVLFLIVILPGLIWFTTRRGALPDDGGVIPLRDAGHPVLLLVDATGIGDSRPRTPSERWYDLEWVNVLTQGYGGCDVADLRVAAGRLTGRQLVVLPRRSASAAPPELLRTLESGIEQGLTVLVEAPDSSLCRRLGLELAAVERRPKLPWPEPVASGARPRLVLRPQPVDVPWTRFRYAPRAANPEERPRVHLSLDGRPMGWVLPRGEGAWATLAVDFAELMARLRDGDEPLLPGQDHAWVDAWIEGVCGGALTDLPLPRLDASPPGQDGWLVLVAPGDTVPAPADTPAPEAGWSRGTSVPFRPLLPSGRLAPAVAMPPLFAGPPEELDPRRLDRWIRHNREGGAGPLPLRLTDGSAPLPAAPPKAGIGEVESWWSARSSIAVHVGADGQDVIYRIGEVPESTASFGLLVPTRWRDRSLEGWDADWGLAPGHRAQRFDRSYRVIAIGPEASGGLLSLRYR
jgi:hypothetical protein